MDHEPSDQPEVLPAAPASPTRPILPAVRAVCLLAAAAFLFAAARRVPAGIGDSGQGALSILALVLASALLLRERRHWSRPSRRLADLLRDVRANRAPMEEVRDTLASTGLAPLAPALDDLLHDLRRQHLEIAQLQDEMRQRIASRTDALERTVGSLRQQAIRDPLTGLSNRRALDEQLPRLIDRCRADGSDLCLLMIDLDHFKHVNDSLGHAAGDGFLADVAGLIRSSVRDTDLAFRYGGDEFAILLPGATPRAARTLADRLVSLARELAKPLHLNPSPCLSVGIASLHAHPGSSPDDLLRAADEDLYRQKSARRTLPLSA